MKKGYFKQSWERKEIPILEEKMVSPFKEVFREVVENI